MNEQPLPTSPCENFFTRSCYVTMLEQAENLTGQETEHLKAHAAPLHS